MVRDTVAMDTLASRATVRISNLPGTSAAGGFAFFPACFTMVLAHSEYAYSIPQQTAASGVRGLAEV
jgi:hypothetical protein